MNPAWDDMIPDYASILKTERLRAGAASSLSAEAESDRGRIVFSPAFRRLQQQGQLFSLASSTAVRSRLSHALQVSQVGRAVAARVASGLAAQGRADGETYAALTSFVETACLARDIGSPPYGEAGAAAIRNWFAEQGPALIRAASLAYGARELEARDPRMLNALADFHQFNEVPQGLRLLGKWHWHGESGGLNLTKTSLAAYLRYLDMSGADSLALDARSGEHAGFFSTEAGLVKGIWSAFGYEAAAPQRFPLTLLVEAAHDIVAGFGDLEDAIGIGVVDAGEALKTLRDDWLSTYIPIDPDEADEAIMELLGKAADAATPAAFSGARAELFAVMADYAARSFLALQEEAFAGRIETILPASSGTAVLLQVLRNFCHARIHTLAAVQRHALDGYNIVRDLLQQFSVLLKISMPRFQAAMGASADPSLFLERQLLALIPSECRLVYTQAMAHLSGRDHEFEEWNARAHLVVDFIASQADTSALAIYRRLAAIDL
jgi:dGTPase